MHIRRPRQARSLTVIQRVVAAALLLATCPPQAIASPREWQPLVLKGAQLPSLAGAEIGRLEILAVRGGKAEPIPFQVDTRSADGSYLLPNGPKAVSVGAHATLTADDEIAMMISDLGERSAGASDLPRGAVEIEVSDPLGGPKRYAYAAVVDSPRLSARRYVAFDSQKDVIETEHFRVGFTNGLPSDFATQSRMDEHSPNLIDRMKVRLSTLVIHLIHFSFSEDDVHSKVLAWKAGPVRVIRRLSHSVNLVLGLHSPVFERNDFFYRDYLENPFKMHLSWAPRIFFGDIRVRIDLDFKDLSGYELLWSKMAMPPVKIGDKAMERRVAEPASIPITWIGIRGQNRTTIQTLLPSPDLALLNRHLYFNDDPNRPDPPERTPGEHPGIGYTITGWEKLESGVHTFDSLLITTPTDYSPDVVLEEMRTPPAVTTRPVAEAK